MYRLHLTRNLRSLAFLLTVALMLSAIVGLWWVNHIGLPGPWRATIEREVAKQGTFITIGGLRYAPFRGVIASNVRIFSEPEHLREISRLENIIIDFNKPKLARGLFQIDKIQLNHAKLELPVDPKNPNSEILQVTDANGTILMPGNRRLEIRNANGKIAGIDISLNLRLIGYLQDGQSQPEDPNMGKRRELVAKIISELEKWQFDENNSPHIEISVEGDINIRSSINAKISLDVRNIEKNGHRLATLTAQADLIGDIFTVTYLRASDTEGAFVGHIDYNLQDQEGRFDVSSSLEIPTLLTAWLGIPALRDVKINGRQFFSGEGNFQIDDSNVPKIQMTGTARCEAVKLRGIPFDVIKLAYSWDQNRMFIRDLNLSRADGEASGKALIEWPLVRLELKTTLPVPVYRPFFIGQPLERVLNDITERQGAAVDIKLEGGFDLTNKYAWAYTGSGTAKNVNYRGVPINYANSKFSLNHYELDFHDGTVDFDYTKYILHKTFNGATEGSVKAGRIRYDASMKMVEVEDVQGLIWAAPMIRLFAPKVADNLEQYRFHQPPELKGFGVIDVTSQGRTALDISFNSPHPADYQFLGKNLTVLNPSALVVIRNEKVSIKNLKFDAFDGPVNADIQYLGDGKMEGEVNWTKLSIPSLASTYGFEIKGGGSVTGRIRFSLSDSKLETMAGEGLLAMEDAKLFSVPMFGPLTPLVGGVLQDKEAFVQSADNAFCTFKIQDGILSTEDFQTSTSSLNFSGVGSVNMNEQTLDMTMRMNARGLLGLITLPLRPFSGLFQFRGTGPLKNTVWESMKFIAPPATKKVEPPPPPKTTSKPSN